MTPGLLVVLILVPPLAALAGVVLGASMVHRLKAGKAPIPPIPTPRARVKQALEKEPPTPMVPRQRP